MTAERWQRVKDVLQAAVEREPELRPAFLDRACAGDPALRREVESLLAAHQEAGSFLESPAVAAARPGDTAPLSAGTRFGPYEITALLGAGGMGEVYRARDDRLGRDVAIKVLPADFARSPERLSRFEQEAQAASALNHPHILTVYDVGRHDGLPYLVTELLEGQTLAERIAQGPVPVRRTLEWASQAARGLAAAHERGIVHRDIKPANLFVTGEGRLKIVDFGLAKLAPPLDGGPLSSRAQPGPRTAPGIPMGTVGYMSPEQVRGEPLDFRTDQFSLGCVLYELLAGKPPFQRATAPQTLAAVLEEEPPSLVERNGRVPPPIAWTVERCLAKDPADRYAATPDLARDLELALGRLSGPGGPVVRRRLPAHGLALAGAVGLALAAAAGAVAWRLRSSLPGRAPVVRYLTYSGRDGSPSASPDGRTIAFSSSRHGRRRIWMMQVATGDEVPLTEGPDDHPRFSPDGTTILFARTEGTRVSLFRVSSLGGDSRRLVDGALYGDFAPDGRRICLVRQSTSPEGMTSTLATVSADGSDLRELARFPGRALVYPRWSPDGRTVAVAEAAFQAGQRTATILVDVESGTSRALTPPDGARSPDGLAWVAPGRVVYSQPEVALGTYRSTSSEIVLHDVQSRDPRSVLSVPLDTRVLDVLGPGRLVFGTRSFRANLREVPLRPAGGGGGRWLTRGNSTDRQPTYDPAGEHVVFSSNRGGNLDLWAVSRSTGAVQRLTADAAEDWDPSFTRDGKLLWSSNRTGTFEVWIAAGDGSGARQVTRDGVDAENPLATPDREWILYASANPRSRGIMKIRPDGSRATLLIPGNVILPELSPDGRHLAFVADLGAQRAALRVARISDGGVLPFEIPLPPWVPAGNIDPGRCRWLPDGQALAFIGQEQDGSYGVSVQDFAPAGGTAARRRLVAFEPDFAAESLGISPDGAHLTVAYWDQVSSLMLADNVPGIQRPRAAR